MSEESKDYVELSEEKYSDMQVALSERDELETELSETESELAEAESERDAYQAEVETLESDLDAVEPVVEDLRVALSETGLSESFVEDMSAGRVLEAVDDPADALSGGLDGDTSGVSGVGGSGDSDPQGGAGEPSDPQLPDDVEAEIEEFEAKKETVDGMTALSERGREKAKERADEKIAELKESVQ